jgi:hypothetical protein
MPGIDFAAVREQIPIRDVLTLLGFQPTSYRRGTRLRGLCPLQCSDDPTAFVADLKIDKFYCHRCHRGGNQLDLWSVTQGLLIYPAAKDLCMRLDIPIPDIERW